MKNILVGITLEANVTIRRKHMTKEEKLIALKEESEARSVVSQLGLRRDLMGTYIIQEFVLGKKKTESLNDKEIEAVLYSWQARHYVPRALIDVEEGFQIKVDNVKLSRENDEKECEYKRRKVKHIERYVKTIQS